jgi:low affinity Fe/Cu permease
MDGSSLKITYHKALGYSNLFYNMGAFYFVFAIASLFFGLSWLLYVLSFISAICLFMFFYYQNITKKIIRLYQWKYDLEDLFDETEENL